MAKIVIKSLDTLPPIDAQLFFTNSDTIPIDLTGCVVTLEVKENIVHGDVFKFPVEIRDLLQGQVRYALATPAIDPVGARLRVGEFKAAWLIVFPDGNRISVPNTEYFTIIVLPSLDEPGL